MAFKPNFNNNVNWTLLSNGAVNANTFTINDQLKHDPISPILITNDFTNRAIAITILTNLYNKPSWTFGGNCEIRLANTGFAAYPIIATVKLINNQTIITSIPYADEGYQLRLIPPSWFWNFNYIIYGYIGEGYPDNSQKLDELASLINTL